MTVLTTHLIAMSFYLDSWLKEAQMTCRQLAERLGIPEATLSKMRKGSQQAPLELLMRIAPELEKRETAPVLPFFIDFLGDYPSLRINPERVEGLNEKAVELLDRVDEHALKSGQTDIAEKFAARVLRTERFSTRTHYVALALLAKIYRIKGRTHDTIILLRAVCDHHDEFQLPDKWVAHSLASLAEAHMNVGCPREAIATFDLAQNLPLDPISLGYVMTYRSDAITLVPMLLEALSPKECDAICKDLSRVRDDLLAQAQVHRTVAAALYGFFLALAAERRGNETGVQAGLKIIDEASDAIDVMPEVKRPHAKAPVARLRALLIAYTLKKGEFGQEDVDAALHDIDETIDDLRPQGHRYYVRELIETKNRVKRMLPTCIRILVIAVGLIDKMPLEGGPCGIF